MARLDDLGNKVVFMYTERGNCPTERGANIDPIPFTPETRSAVAGKARLFRHVLGTALALLLALATLPLILILGLLVKWTSPGPAFYAQRRLGKGGRVFRILKLRTMVDDCERETGPCWSHDGDPRITPLGSFLRRLHLDELPQLWNVVRGDMCLVGPRPERPEIAGELERLLPAYSDRLLVRPGITGLAQVQLPPDTDLDSVRRKLAYDLFYLRNANLFLDVRILASTVGKLMGISRAALRVCFRLPQKSAVESDAMEQSPSWLEIQMT